MPDPLRHADLVSDNNRLASARLETLIGHILNGEPELTALTAAASAFLAACDSAEVDADAVLAQVADAVDSGYLDLSSEEAEHLDQPYNITH